MIGCVMTCILMCHVPVLNRVTPVYVAILVSAREFPPVLLMVLHVSAVFDIVLTSVYHSVCKC